MQVTVSADWHTYAPKGQAVLGHRIEIAGYTASVVEYRATNGQPLFEFTVLHDHVRVLHVGVRDSLDEAKTEAEFWINQDITHNLAEQA